MYREVFDQRVTAIEPVSGSKTNHHASNSVAGYVFVDLLVAALARSRAGRSSFGFDGRGAPIAQKCGASGFLATGVRDGSLASFPRKWLDERWTLAVAYHGGRRHTGVI